MSNDKGLYSELSDHTFTDKNGDEWRPVLVIGPNDEED